MRGKRVELGRTLDHVSESCQAEVDEWLDAQVVGRVHQLEDHLWMGMTTMTTQVKGGSTGKAGQDEALRYVSRQGW